MTGRTLVSGALIVALGSLTCLAQQPPAVRQLGRLERISSDSLASIAAALPLPGGRVMVNDRIARRVLLFDSTLAHTTIVADTTGATANAYGSRPGVLIQYRGDTAILIDQSSLSMYVIGPAGTIVRVMAIPRPEDAQSVGLGSAFDLRGRLFYVNALGSLSGFVMLGRGDPVSKEMRDRFDRKVDSAFIVRADPATRLLDSAATLHIPKLKRVLETGPDGLLTSIETTYDPLPLVDGWTMMRDGSIAIVRGRDYHVDWVAPDGKVTSSPKMPFDWQHVDDARKEALIDSTVKRWQAQADQVMGAAPRSGASVGGSGNSGGRGGSGPPGASGSASGNLAPLVTGRPGLSDVPDYVPPFTSFPGAVTADADGNVWIRTTTMVRGQPVYDIVNRRGELFDRVQLPSFRTIAGFGPGVVYMAVKDSTGIVRLERARVR